MADQKQANRPNARATQSFIWLAFFLSGVAGLSYELTWMRYLVSVFGASTPAVSATVAIMFTGLALGAGLGGKVFDRAKKPLRRYAALELLVGGSALLVPSLFALADRMLITQLGSAGDSTIVLLLASTAVLIVPTTLLGATFPGMAAVVRQISNPTHSTGLFYGFNTLGAVVGCVLVSFWCLATFGNQTTIGIMAAVNLTVAILVVAVSRFASGTDGEAPRPVSSEAPARGPLAIKPRTAALLAMASGFLGIGVEVLWTRALALSFPATVYVFAIVLSAYLLGIGLGSLVLGAFHRRRSPSLMTLRALYLIAGVGVALTPSIFPALHSWGLRRLASGAVTAWTGHIGTIAGSAVLVMLPATLAMGAALPLLIGLATRNRAQSGQVAGRLYAANTLAGVAGSLIVTFGLMPALGLSRTLMGLAICYFAICWVIPVPNPKRITRLATNLGLGGAIALGVLMVTFDAAPEVNPLRYRPGHSLLFYSDAPSGTVAVYEDENEARALRVNNMYGLSDTRFGTLVMQYTLGALPMALKPDAERGLLIGFATGTTLSAMAEHSQAEIDCVELHSHLFELAPLFEQANHAVWDHPRVSLIQADGRRFTARPGPAYDVIVGDLYLPRNAGVAAMYSIEHFRAVRSRLAPGGVFVAWLPLFQLGPEEVATVTQTFLAAFDNAEGWVGSWSVDRPILGLVGWSGNEVYLPDISENALSDRLTDSLARSYPGQELSELGWPASPGPLPSSRLLDTEMLRSWAGDAPLNTLDRTVVEYSSPRTNIQSRLEGNPLGMQNIQRIGVLRPLEGTPWASNPE